MNDFKAIRVIFERLIWSQKLPLEPRVIGFAVKKVVQ
jgi:hypothetical protein